MCTPKLKCYSSAPAVRSLFACVWLELALPQPVTAASQPPQPSHSPHKQRSLHTQPLSPPHKHPDAVCLWSAHAGSSRSPSCKRGLVVFRRLCSPAFLPARVPLPSRQFPCILLPQARRDVRFPQFPAALRPLGDRPADAGAAPSEPAAGPRGPACLAPAADLPQTARAQALLQARCTSGPGQPGHSPCKRRPEQRGHRPQPFASRSPLSFSIRPPFSPLEYLQQPFHSPSRPMLISALAVASNTFNC